MNVVICRSCFVLLWYSYASRMARSMMLRLLADASAIDKGSEEGEEAKHQNDDPEIPSNRIVASSTEDVKVKQNRFFS